MDRAKDTAKATTDREVRAKKARMPVATIGGMAQASIE
jgi:hypothetical protein